MTGGLISFGDALKAFRRSVYMHSAFGWNAVVVCATHTQARYAMDAARSVLDASSLPVQSFMHTSMKITTDRGGELKFIAREHCSDLHQLQGYHFQQAIIVDPNLPQRELAVLQAHLRHPDIEDRYFRIDQATL